MLCEQESLQRRTGNFWNSIRESSKAAEEWEINLTRKTSITFCNFPPSSLSSCSFRNGYTKSSKDVETLFKPFLHKVLTESIWQRVVINVRLTFCKTMVVSQHNSKCCSACADPTRVQLLKMKVLTLKQLKREPVRDIFLQVLRTHNRCLLQKQWRKNAFYFGNKEMEMASC